jgi:hypothetical protein
MTPMKNSINSLQALRERKSLVATQLEQREAQLKFNLYLCSHPVEWVANALTTQRNAGFSANNDLLVKFISLSRKTYTLWSIASKLIKLIRKK